MLQFIYGTAGTGKTTKLTEEIGHVLAEGKKAILLVPEQFSFQSERRIYRDLGPSSSLQVEVLSFTRLCNNIFRTFGGLAGTPLTPTAQYLLMSVAVQELQDQLKVYRKSAQNTAFLSTLLSSCSEFKSAGIGPHSLELFVNTLEEGQLKDKMQDLSLVYSAYQNLLEKGYTDPEDDIIRACGILENNSYFHDYHVFVDGFTTFMAGEFMLLEFIIAQSPHVTFAMTTDCLVDHQEGTGVFSVVQQAIKRLSELAEQHTISIEEPCHCQQGVRYHAPALEALSRNFFQPQGEVFPTEIENIIVYPSSDTHQEIVAVASQIVRLVREKGYRYRDIGVISRREEEYAQFVELEFSRYKIPYFHDATVVVENSPLIFGILTAFDAIQNNFNGETVLFFAKSPILGLPIEEVSQLENYCYTWQIKGQLWKSDFINHPRGMVEEFSEADKALLEKINEIRSKIMRPLEDFALSIENCNGKEFATALYTFLEQIEATQHLMQYAEGMPEGERETFLAINSQLWDSMIDILDIFGQVLEQVVFKRNRFIDLFRLAASSAEVGVLPQTLDQVLVGSADRIRPAQLKAVFVIGANEGVFPAMVGNVGVFSEMERNQLVHFGLQISNTGMHQALLERFYAYFACTLPSDLLFVSWSRSNLKGEERFPSMIITELDQKFPHHLLWKPQKIDFVEGKYSALSLLSQEMRADTVESTTLWEYFRQTSPAILHHMEVAAFKPPHQLKDVYNVTGLFGTSMRLSPSRVERFQRCPFAYFMQYGLKLKKRQKVEFSPLESGSLIHHILQVVLQKYGGKGLSKRTISQLEEEVSQIILEYLETRIQDVENMSRRFHYLFQRLCTTVAKLLEHLGKEFLQSEFDPIAFELEISSQAGIPPIPLTTENGIKVQVEGIVDRVDAMKKNGKTYIRVVDYKSGSKDFRLSDILYGLNLQMLLYLFTITEQGSGEFQDSIPAGVLYMPVRESYKSLDRHTSPEEAQKQLEKQWTMTGLLLEDEDVLVGMEEELNGLFIPVKKTKKGEISVQSSIANQEELGRISRQVQREIISMADALSQGEIHAIPVNTLEYPTCSYCDYKDVCGFEEGDPTKEVMALSQNEVLEFLEQMEQEE